MRARRYQGVAQELRGMMTEGHFAVGQRLPPERAIADELGAPRATVREALIALEIEGLVEVRQGSGVWVKALPTGAAAAALDVGPFELLQARQLLESRIAGLAAAQVGKSDILAMQAALDKETAAGGGYDSDERFHRLIAEATRNGALVATVEGLWAMRAASTLWSRLHARIFDATYRRRWLDDHAAILAALKRRDAAGAHDAMWEHLGRVRATLLELSDPADPEFDAFLFGPVAPPPRPVV